MKFFLKTALLAAIFLPQIGHAQSGNANGSGQKQTLGENGPKGRRLSEVIKTVGSQCLSDQAEIAIKAEKNGELSVTPDKSEVVFRDGHLEETVLLDIATNLLDMDHQLSYVATQLTHDDTKQVLNYTVTLDDNKKETTTDKEMILTQSVKPSANLTTKTLKIALSKEAFEKASKGKFSGGNIRITLGVGC